MCQVSWSLDHYLGHNSILKLRFNFRFLKKALYFCIITFYMPCDSVILGPLSWVRPFTETFLKLQYLGYISVPSSKSLALGGTLPHSGPRLILSTRYNARSNTRFAMGMTPIFFSKIWTHIRCLILSFK